MLECHLVSKSFQGCKVLDNCQFRIEKGEIVGLMGPSGTGKTCLARILAGLETADQGQVFLEGRIYDRREVGPKIHLVFQDAFHALNPKLNFEAATKAALKEVGAGSVTDISLDRDNKQVVYEVRIESKDKEIELELNADSGKVVRKSEEPLEADDKLKAQPEKSIADVEKALLKEYPSAKILDISLENTSKSVTYQAEILNGDTFQEILIDAKTLNLTEAPSDY